jgi:hypothetical protein
MTTLVLGPEFANSLFIKISQDQMLDNRLIKVVARLLTRSNVARARIWLFEWGVG